MTPPSSTPPFGSLPDDSTLRAYLAEDLGSGDLTSEALVESSCLVTARMIAKEPGVVAGLTVAARVFTLLDANAAVTFRVQEGEAVSPGDEVLTVAGRARSILAAERLALNLAQRASGIATATRAYVDAVAGTRAAILETRKTAPGLRWLDKAAVIAGGGQNHRMGLHDQILIKENHVSALASTLGHEGPRRPLEEAVSCAKAHAPGRIVQIEVFDVAESLRAGDAGADIVLLDNFTVADVTAAVEAHRDRPTLLEASGGIDRTTVVDYARTGVHRISIGALTHSVQALDLSLLVPIGEG